MIKKYLTLLFISIFLILLLKYFKKSGRRAQAWRNIAEYKMCSSLKRKLLSFWWYCTHGYWVQSYIKHWIQTFHERIAFLLSSVLTIQTWLDRWHSRQQRLETWALGLTIWSDGYMYVLLFLPVLKIWSLCLGLLCSFAGLILR